MPSISGAFGTVRGFMSIVREVDFDEVRGRAEAAPVVLVVADQTERAEAAVSGIFGDDALRFVDVRTDWFQDIDGARYDVILVVDPEGTGILRPVREAVGQDASRKVLFAPMTPSGMTPAEITGARDAVVMLDPELAPALGRRFPALRLAAVRTIVNDTAKANAQFALVSNAPAVIPVVGGIVAASADLIVLTKNQVMMVFKIAAAHDRDLRNQMTIMRELAPVVGSGFVWRTIGREAAAFMPLAAGTVPKVAIAWVGTVVMGRAADYYYRFGKKPTRERLKEFTRKATENIPRLQISRHDEEATGDADGADTETTRGR